MRKQVRFCAATGPPGPWLREVWLRSTEESENMNGGKPKKIVVPAGEERLKAFFRVHLTSLGTVAFAHGDWFLRCFQSS